MHVISVAISVDIMREVIYFIPQLRRHQDARNGRGVEADRPIPTWRGYGAQMRPKIPGRTVDERVLGKARVTVSLTIKGRC